MEENQKKHKSFYVLIVTVLILAFFAVGISAAMYFLKPTDYVWTNDAVLNAYGSNLSANVTGQITMLYVDEGDVVKSGQPIAQLWDNIPLAQKEAAEARIKKLEEDVAVREGYFKKVRNDYIRADEGIESQVISAQDYDHAEKNFEIAEAELKMSYASLELARKELEVIHAELTHYVITAPHDGVIAKRWVWLGDVVIPSQSLFTLYNLADIWVLANLEEYKIKNVKLGDPVDIQIDAYPGIVFHGNVFTIKAAAASQFSLVPQNNATGNYTKVAQRLPIKISVKPPEDFPEDQPLYLFPGMSAEVYIKAKP